MLELDFSEGEFDAVYSLNCLLHVPNENVRAALTGIRRVMRPGGLFYLGVYGGDGDEGTREWDDHDPPRFFSLRTDDQIQRIAANVFEIAEFHVVETRSRRFQSLTLRNPW